MCKKNHLYKNAGAVMENKRFAKNDNGFICVNCGAKVAPLGYTSRDHCPHCLTSIHIDINPGDRENTCCGLLVPVDIITNKKGDVIKYKCEKCGEYHNNKTATDDDFDVLLSVMNHTYNYKKFSTDNND